MLLKWIKDFTSVVIIATFINTLIFILNDQKSLIGTWEIQYDDPLELPGNYYDILKIRPDGTFEHLTFEHQLQGQYHIHDEQITFVYDDQSTKIFIIQINQQLIEDINTGQKYKKITLFE
jgi:hypothetical protein